MGVLWKMLEMPWCCTLNYPTTVGLVDLSRLDGDDHDDYDSYWRRVLASIGRMCTQRWRWWIAESRKNTLTRLLRKSTIVGLVGNAWVHRTSSALSLPVYTHTLQITCLPLRSIASAHQPLLFELFISFPMLKFTSHFLHFCIQSATALMSLSIQHSICTCLSFTPSGMFHYALLNVSPPYRIKADFVLFSFV